MGTPIKIGIVGFSLYAETSYLDYLLSSQEVLLAGICDLPGRREHSGLLAPGIPFFTDLETMIHALALDALLISTPHQLHYSHALKGLEKGLHVFVDKPLASTAAEAGALVEQSRQKNKALLSGLPKRYSLVMKIIHDLIHSGELGEILNLDFVYYRPRYQGFENSWRNDPKCLGGVIFDAGYQQIDALLGLKEEPVHSITCLAGKQGLKVESMAKITMGFKDSPTLGSIHLGLHPPNGIVIENIVIQGTKGVVVFKRVKQDKKEIIRDFYLLVGNKMEKMDSREKKNIDLEPLLDFIFQIRSGKGKYNLLNRDVRTISFIERAYGAFLQEANSDCYPSGRPPQSEGFCIRN